MNNSDAFLSLEWYSALLGLVISLVSVAVGASITWYAYKKDYRSFVKIVLGSMIARIFAVLGVVWCIFYFRHVEQLWFSISFVISYFVLLMTEIFSVHHQYTVLKTRQRISLMQTAFFS